MACADFELGIETHCGDTKIPLPHVHVLLLGTCDYDKGKLSYRWNQSADLKLGSESALSRQVP